LTYFTQTYVNLGRSPTKPTPLATRSRGRVHPSTRRPSPPRWS
jgi:hypothetical protein